MMNIHDDVLLYAPGNLYWKDTQGNYLGCNIEFARIAGLNSPEEIIGKTDRELFSSLLGDKGVEKLLEVDREVVGNGKDYLVEELGVNIHGEKAYYLTKKIPLKNSQGQIIGLVGNSIDISKLKETEPGLKKATEHALQKAKELGEVAKKAKAEFLANMCHDFRTPFSGLLSMSSLMHERETDPNKKEDLGIIMESAQILLDDLNQIFDFIDQEQNLDSFVEQFDPRELLNKVIKVMLPKMAEKHLLLELAVGDLPPYVVGDSIRTKRILENLLVNAFKFTQQGKIVLRAEKAELTENHAKNAQLMIKFSVQDTGIGMAVGTRELIFEPLQRLTPAYQGIYAGKGLGLRLVKCFLDHLGGEIRVESKLGEGSEFQVFIPYKLPS